MFPIDPNAPSGPDRSESLRRSHLDHTLVREHLPTLTLSQGNPRHVSRSVLSGRPTAAARQSGTVPGVEPVPAQQSMGSRSQFELTFRPPGPKAR
jgi:hypothetical protein